MLDGALECATKNQKVRRCCGLSALVFLAHERILCLPTDLLHARIENFKAWLKARPEETIVVVGHSNFFRKFTGMKEKLANCEIHLHHL